ncbi:MAG: hypothetical protein QOJ15_7726 [Bradyrhizobium sp.]|nr:hypothetical protein [Bradyrhizobium sp.]
MSPRVTTNETARGANCHLQSLATGQIYPLQSQILKASLHVATRVAEHIFDKNIAGVSRPNDFGALIRTPAYRPVLCDVKQARIRGSERGTREVIHGV